MEIARNALEVLLVRFKEIDDGDVGYGIARTRNVPEKRGSEGAATVGGESLFGIHVHGYTHGSQVADAHDTADDIATQIVEDKNFPDGVPVGIEYGGDWCEKAIGLDFVGLSRFDRLVEVEDLFERGLRTGG